MSRIAYPVGDRFVEDLVAPCTSPASPLPPEIHIDLKALNLKIDTKEDKKGSISWSRELTNPRELYKIPVPSKFFVKLPSIKNGKQYFKPNETWKELAEIGAKKEVNLLNIPDKLPSPIESSIRLSSPVATIKKTTKQMQLRQIDMNISITPREVLQRRHHVRQVQEKLQNILHQTKHSNKRRAKKVGLRDEFFRQKSILGLNLCCPNNLQIDMKRSKTGLIPIHNKLIAMETKSVEKSNTSEMNDLAIISSRWPQAREEKRNSLTTANIEKPLKSSATATPKVFNILYINKTKQKAVRE
ncbi:DgyrCDS1363 [Dimorphilus gyrociliatus]|uniref:DgyrCDS1363 n=1 Tax=Dimorphilus gyrociliatus TaxID=2664684 RepID=A0A7I8V9Y7_9ANNE|nr:DgyrCDS1363 [Dimorphilus gyrociliatus]